MSAINMFVFRVRGADYIVPESLAQHVEEEVASVGEIGKDYHLVTSAVWGILLTG